MTANAHGTSHDGKVMVMRSNLRWRSDGLEFTCGNDEVIRLAFTNDTFDREITAWTAVANGGISESGVRDMMLEALEKRVGSTKAPNPIKHLSDIGSACCSPHTRPLAQTSHASSRSNPNGMPEAFVKTPKREYNRISPLPDAQTAPRQIDGGIEGTTKSILIPR